MFVLFRQIGTEADARVMRDWAACEIFTRKVGIEAGYKNGCL